MFRVVFLLPFADSIAFDPWDLRDSNSPGVARGVDQPNVTVDEHSKWGSHLLFLPPTIRCDDDAFDKPIFLDRLGICISRDKQQDDISPQFDPCIHPPQGNSLLHPSHQTLISDLRYPDQEGSCSGPNWTPLHASCPDKSKHFHMTVNEEFCLWVKAFELKGVICPQGYKKRRLGVPAVHYCEKVILSPVRIEPAYNPATDPSLYPTNKHNPWMIQTFADPDLDWNPSYHVEPAEAAYQYQYRRLQTVLPPSSVAPSPATKRFELPGVPLEVDGQIYHHMTSFEDIQDYEEHILRQAVTVDPGTEDVIEEETRKNKKKAKRKQKKENETQSMLMNEEQEPDVVDILICPPGVKLIKKNGERFCKYRVIVDPAFDYNCKKEGFYWHPDLARCTQIQYTRTVQDCPDGYFRLDKLSGCKTMEPRKGTNPRCRDTNMIVAHAPYNSDQAGQVLGRWYYFNERAVSCEPYVASGPFVTCDNYGVGDDFVLKESNGEWYCVIRHQQSLYGVNYLSKRDELRGKMIRKRMTAWDALAGMSTGTDMREIMGQIYQ